MSRPKKRKKIYIWLAVLALLIFLHVIKVVEPLERAFIERFLNIQGEVFSQANTISYSFINYKEAKDLVEQNQRLQDLASELMYKSAQLGDLQIENDNLRALLQYKEIKNTNMVVSKVIGKDTTRQNTLILNKGTVDGINVGAPVIVGNGVLVGKVISARDHTATVLLLIDQEMEVAVTVPGHDGSLGVASGEYGLSIMVSLIPQTTSIAEGDTIITSGLEGYIPRGLVIGQINRVLEQEGALFKSATVNTIINYKNISIVSILRD